MEIYSIRAAATTASMPPETRLAIPALVVGTALWDAVELAAPEELALALVLAEVDFAEVSVAEAEVLVAVLEAVVKVVGELVVVAEEVEVDFSEVVWVVEVDDSVDD